MLRSFTPSYWLPLNATVIAKERDPAVRSFLYDESRREWTWYARGKTVVNPPPDVLAAADVRALIREVPLLLLPATVEPTAMFGTRAFVREKPKPFLLTEDIDVLIGRWLRLVAGCSVPRIRMRAITDALFTVVRRWFPDAFLLRSGLFRRQLAAICATAKSICGWPVITVSLDRDCAPPADYVVEVTRVRDARTLRPLGEIARPGQPSFREQVRAIIAMLPRRHAVRIIVDGCWSGSEVLRLVEEFARFGIPTDQVVTGILRARAAAEFRAAGIPIIASHPYLGLDAWICQRDFLPGVPRSGLNLGAVVNGNAQAFVDDIGAAYILPFREDFLLEELTPHGATEFSIACLAFTDQLFRDVERAIGKPLCTAALARIPNIVRVQGTRYREELRWIAATFLKHRDALGPINGPAHHARGFRCRIDIVAFKSVPLFMGERGGPIDSSYIHMPQQPHIHLDEGQFPTIALLPGDPKRVLRIADSLADVRHVTENREYLGVVGTYRGIPIGVLSTGMGCPSAAIAVEELANIGVRTFIRIGTCGALRADIAPGDCIVPFAAVRAEGTTKEYLPPEFPAVADPDVYQALVRAAQGRRVQYHVGVDRCHDAFYEPIANMVRWGDLSRDFRFRGTPSPLVSSEMECSAIFLVAMLRGCRAGAVLAVNTTEPLDQIRKNPALAYELINDPRATGGIDHAIAVALDAAIALIQATSA